MINISKTLIELIFVVGSLLVLAASGAFAFATIRAQLIIAKIQLELKTNNLEFARKVQQNIDHNNTEIGVLKCEIHDIKGILKKWDKNVRERQKFPEENIPPRTDFT